MTKAQLLEQICNGRHVSRQEALAILESFMKTVKAALIRGENVYLRGFGTFHVVKRAEKTARVITRNETLIIPEHYIPKFKPSKEFSNKVKQKLKVEKPSAIHN